jgi:AcrR family transcriptional regulator
MERSRLDVVAWFTGARLIRTSEGRIAPRVLAEQLSVSYQTALRIKKRVLAASAAGGSDAQLLERLWQEAQGANTVDANAPALSADRSSKARDHIRAAACRTFAARGLSSTRIVDIAAEAKVSSAIIHYYYTSKDELLLAALQWAMEQTYGRIDELRAETDDPCAQLRGILELAAPSEGRLHDEVLLWLEIWVRVRSHPELLAGCVAMSDFWLASVREVIEEGASAGVFRLEIPAADVAQRLVALADGLSFRSAVGYTGMHVQRVNEMLLDFAAEQLRVPAARLRSKR